MSDFFSKYEHISLDEDNAGSNYETYRGIIFDPEENAFKVVEGKFQDKKDMYEKMVKRGYVLRKCFEKKIFDWIEENSPSNLIAYLMYSTAFSKWRNNNLLSDYYVKLLNDIPEINREGRKGDPQSRGKKAMGGFSESFLNNFVFESVDETEIDFNNITTLLTEADLTADDAGFKSTGWNDPNEYTDKHDLTVSLINEKGKVLDSVEIEDVEVSGNWADFRDKGYDDVRFWTTLKDLISGNKSKGISGFIDELPIYYSPDPKHPEIKVMAFGEQEEKFRDALDKKTKNNHIKNYYYKKSQHEELTDEEKQERHNANENLKKYDEEYGKFNLERGKGYISVFDNTANKLLHKKDLDSNKLIIPTIDEVLNAYNTKARNTNYIARNNNQFDQKSQAYLNQQKLNKIVSEYANKASISNELVNTISNKQKQAIENYTNDLKSQHFADTLIHNECTYNKNKYEYAKQEYKGYKNAYDTLVDITEILVKKKTLNDPNSQNAIRLNTILEDLYANLENGYYGNNIAQKNLSKLKIDTKNNKITYPDDELYASIDEGYLVTDSANNIIGFIENEKTENANVLDSNNLSIKLGKIHEKDGKWIVKEDNESGKKLKVADNKSKVAVKSIQTINTNKKDHKTGDIIGRDVAILNKIVGTIEGSGKNAKLKALNENRYITEVPYIGLKNKFLNNPEETIKKIDTELNEYADEVEKINAQKANEDEKNKLSMDEDEKNKEYLEPYIKDKVEDEKGKFGLNDDEFIKLKNAKDVLKNLDLKYSKTIDELRNKLDANHRSVSRLNLPHEEQLDYAKYSTRLKNDRIAKFLNGIDSRDDILELYNKVKSQRENIKDKNSEDYKKVNTYYWFILDNKLLGLSNQEFERYKNFKPLEDSEVKELRKKCDELWKKGTTAEKKAQDKLIRDQLANITTANPIHGGDNTIRFDNARDKSIQKGSELDIFNNYYFGNEGYLNADQAKQYMNAKNNLEANSDNLTNNIKQALRNTINSLTKTAYVQGKYKNLSVIDKLDPKFQEEYNNLKNSVDFFIKQKNNFEKEIKQYYEPVIKNKQYINISKDNLNLYTKSEQEEIKKIKQDYKALLQWLDNNGFVLDEKDANSLLDEENPKGIKSILTDTLSKIDNNLTKAQSNLINFIDDHDLDFVNKEKNHDFIKDIANINNYKSKINTDELNDMFAMNQKSTQDLMKTWINANYDSLEDYEADVKKNQDIINDRKLERELERQERLDNQEKLHTNNINSEKSVELNNKLDVIDNKINDLEDRMFDIINNDQYNFTDDEIKKYQDMILDEIQKLKTERKTIEDELNIISPKEEAVFVNQGVNTLDNERKYKDSVFFENAQQTLNDKLFTGNTLKDDVREALLKVAETFKQYLNLDIEPVDIYFTGSNANYNYTDQSDIDLHLVFDFEKVGINAEILNKYLKEAKTVFNAKYDIKIKGLPVEIGCENIAEPLVSSGIYSVINNQWVTEPSIVYNDNSFEQAKYDEITNEIEDAIESKDSSTIGALWKMLGALRKDSLASEGEYGKGNLLFKKLRNMDYLKRLKDAYYNAASKELSLEAWDMDLNDNDISNKSKSAEGYASEMPKTKQPRLRDVYNKAIKQLSEDAIDDEGKRRKDIYNEWKAYVNKHTGNNIPQDQRLPICPEFNSKIKDCDISEFLAFAHFGFHPDLVKEKVFLINDGNKLYKIMILGIDKVYYPITRDVLPDIHEILIHNSNKEQTKNQISKALNINKDKIIYLPGSNLPYIQKKDSNVYIYVCILDDSNLYKAEKIVRIEAPKLFNNIKSLPENKATITGLANKTRNMLDKYDAESLTDLIKNTKEQHLQNISDFGNSKIIYDGNRYTLSELLPKYLWRELYIQTQGKFHKDIQDVFDDIKDKEPYKSEIRIMNSEEYSVKDNTVFDNEGKKIGIINEYNYIADDTGKIIGKYNKDNNTVDIRIKKKGITEDTEDSAVIRNDGEIRNILLGNDSKIKLPQVIIDSVPEDILNELATHQHSIIHWEREVGEKINDFLCELDGLRIDNENNIIGFILKNIISYKLDPRIRAKNRDTFEASPKLFAKILTTEKNIESIKNNKGNEEAINQIISNSTDGTTAALRVKTQTGNSVTYSNSPLSGVLSPEEIIMLLNYFEQHYGNASITFAGDTLDLSKYVNDTGKNFHGVVAGPNFLARLYKHILENIDNVKQQKEAPEAALVQGVMHALVGQQAEKRTGKGNPRISIKRAPKTGYLTFMIEDLLTDQTAINNRHVAHNHQNSPFKSFVRANLKK